jgi:hypothetical protein
MEEKPKVKCEACGKECANLGSHLRFCPGREVKPDTKPETPKLNDITPKENINIVPKNKTTVALFNTSGREVPVEDYFYKGVIAPGFEKICGKPVEREDLLAVFNKVFKLSDNFLFYKVLDKEVYIIIPPLKYAPTVGEAQNSIEGEFQKHAISFIGEGSVNLDTLRMKLERIPRFCKFDDR